MLVAALAVVDAVSVFEAPSGVLGALAGMLVVVVLGLGLHGIRVTLDASSVAILSGCLPPGLDCAALSDCLMSVPGVIGLAGLADAARPAPANPPANPPANLPLSADASVMAQGLRCELAQLALPDISVEVNPVTRQIILRGSASTAARKAQALAAARAINPGGRVRDVVFLVKE